MTTATQKSRTRRKAPQVLVSFAKFDTREPIYRVAREGVPIGDFQPLTLGDYRPSGGTPLRDAVARMIGHGDELRGPDHVTILLLADESGSMGGNEQAVVSGINRFVDGMSDVKAVDPKTAGTVLAVVVTDGYENSSREVDHPTLQKLIHDREADGWVFIFLGANIDAWAQGTSLGLSGGVTGQTVSYQNTPKGTAAVMDSITTDSAGYLSNMGSYKAQRTASGSTMRSVTETGEETLANINSGQTFAPNFTVQSVTYNTYGNVEEALKKAKKVTS